jgi:hypothetical protein
MLHKEIAIKVPRAPGEFTFGNSLLRLLYARYLQRVLPLSSSIYDFSLPEFNINFPKSELKPHQYLPIRGQGLSKNQVKILPGVLKHGNFHGLSVEALGMQYLNFAEDLTWLRDKIKEIDRQDLLDSEEDFVISVRGGEILSPIHLDYHPLPIEIYESIQRKEAKGHRLCFVGQLDSRYGRELKSRFKTSRFIDCHPLQAFYTLRDAKQKFISISTFSWIAAWLSDSDARIVMPLAGQFNPFQRSDIDMIPWADSRYSFRWVAPSRNSVGVKRRLITRLPNGMQHRILMKKLVTLHGESGQYFSL